MTDQVKILTFLNESNFDLEASLFKITMYNNHTVILEPPSICTLSFDFGLL